MKKIITTTLLTLTLTHNVLAEDAASVSVKRLTLNSATSIAQGAIDSCREKGIQVGVTVVDRNGIVQVAMRDTLASPIVLTVSEGKAKAAALFGTSTAELKERSEGPLGRLPGLVMSQGGLIIQAGGQTYGAIGVSGAPSGATDDECAIEGMKSVVEDLEMGM